MRKLLISAVSLAALTAGGIAFAQEQQPGTTQEQMNQPAQPGTEQPAQPGTDQNKTTVPQDTTANQPPAAGSSGLTVSGLEPGNVIMASSLIGSGVYTSANENVGDINDVILGKDGKVMAVIIGVGGFLGLGEKDVAVPMDKIQMSQDENNNTRYVVSATREELEQAPAFDRTKLVIGSQPPPATTGQ